ncbi:COG4315 family predicted lipoprotein [Streptomyces sp. NBC_00344]|uniref:COG4315 family predicted lipoprotein n=1 Tax=Streptomyces sp. NBC_00344 TaxID=2975720 RepID=UPI002E21ED61
MKSNTTKAAAMAAVAVIAAAVSGCSSGGGSTSQGSAAGSSPSSSMQASSTSTASAVKTVMLKNTPFGKILVNGKGRTLYLFEADKTSKSTCSDACAQAWPPLIVKGTPTAGSGVQTKLMSTSVRSGGSKQVTYKGHPLYTYQGDHKAGQTNGQGLNQFGAKWYVVNADGKKVTAKPTNSSSSPTSSSSPSASSSSGGGY